MCRNLAARLILMGALLMGPGLASAQTTAGTYKAKCAMCHGADGKGNTGAGKAMGVHDFSSEAVQKMSEGELAAIISKGKNKMPAYATKLKEPEIKDLAGYVHELGKK